MGQPVQIEAPFRARLATGREHLYAPVLPAVRVTQPPLEEVFFLILSLILSARGLPGVRMQVLERYLNVTVAAAAVSSCRTPL